MRKINKIKIVAGTQNKSKKIKADLERILNEYNFEINDMEYDLVIAIGGDGTFINAVRELHFDSNIYYVGINTGTLEFLQEIKPEEIENFVRRLANDEFKTEKIGLQETEVITKEGSYRFFSLNEIVIRDYKFKTTFLVVKVNDELLEEFAGDGLLISTSLGSTAYNASLGGAMIGSGIHTVQITPIAPLVNHAYHSLKNSLVLPEHNIITVEPSHARDNDLLVIVDGVEDVYKDVIHVTTKAGDKHIACLRLNDYNFTNRIHAKFLK